MPLTDTKARNAKPKDKQFKLIDTDGLFLLVTPAGVIGNEGSFVTKCTLLRLAPLLFVRPGELRQMEWAEIDLDAAEWNIPAEKNEDKTGLTIPKKGI